VLEAFEPRVDGEQLTDVTVVAAPGTSRVTVVVGSSLPSTAETVAEGELPDVRVPVVAEKVVLFSPECTATLVGTLSAGLLLCNRTAV
jgi:hypothetical protein